ncbi:iron chelate uptake ABC transporter family permease subunit [Thermobacillus sp. ZCTH02-B1]|uniref:iron chelate uptake ABC transporter family permease subunit n=1 Tax=Thermobacillus sp. ZCTH02-B1 TaxID=1858795 RepID=UPI0025D90338|nr:iron chelate uptake ABC transporter family permease subunit [Thermobacillus sp. ZCTH02-B1]
MRVRRTGAFRTRRDARRYWLLLCLFLGAGVAAVLGLILYNQPVPVDSPSFIPVVKRRLTSVTAMFIAALCHSFATVAFQSVTGNRIITPSLLGYESLYSFIQTSVLFFFGATTLVRFTGTGAFFLQVALMIGLSLILFGWLLSGRYGNLHLMLLVGIIIGAGLNSVSGFMRRVLSPSEFDLLQARLIGSVNNADAAYFPIVIPLVLATALAMFLLSRRLNVLSLGRDAATAFGVHYQAHVILFLVLIAVLMATTTALIGPMTFFGFLVAMLSYQAAPTHDHRYVLPMAFAIGFGVLTSAYFLLYHVFHAQTVVSVLIELFGGIAFLTVLLRKRSL